MSALRARPRVPSTIVKSKKSNSFSNIIVFKDFTLKIATYRSLEANLRTVILTTALSNIMP